MSGVVDHLTHRSYDFTGLRTTQVYKDLYAFTQSPLAAVKYENATSLRADMAPAKKELASAGHQRIGFAVANLKNQTIFCTGGESENSETNGAWSYSIQDDTWHELIKMNEARFNHGSIGLDDKVYAFGGYRRGPGYLETIEIYDTTLPKQSWSLIRNPAFTKRENPSVCVLRHD